MQNKHPDALLFAVPNGGHRHKATAAKLKREGVVAGVPDLFFCRAGSAPLWIEMKRQKGGVVSRAQKKMHKSLINLGHHVIVCAGADKAIQAIQEYLR
jgi:hypothetical protein